MSKSDLELFLSITEQAEPVVAAAKLHFPPPILELQDLCCLSCQVQRLSHPALVNTPYCPISSH